MLDIGIDRNQGLFYEGSYPHGRAIWPNPFISPAKIVLASDNPLAAATRERDELQFREDYFDPISQIRRGRFYASGGQQPREWHLQPHPAILTEAASMNRFGELQKTLDTFHGVPFRAKFLKGAGTEQPLVLLGLYDTFTIWTVVSSEIISTGEELVTLKSRRSIGVLPVVDFDQIKDPHSARVSEALDELVNEVHRAAPISVIDRARDAASQILLAHYHTDEGTPKDLGDLAKRLEKQKKIIAASSAKIIARLHSRGKATERAKYPEMRQIREEDAQLAIQCVGTLLCELGWADWR